MSQRFESIQKTLLALSTAASVAACASQKPAQDPVKASETTSAQTAGANGEHSCGANGQGSCSANKAQGSCGANKGQGSCSANKADSTAAATAGAADPATTTAAASDADPKAPAKPKTAPKKAGGQKSCGAGTCGKK